MAKYEITLSDDQDAGVTDAREQANQFRSEDNQLADNQAYVQFVMGSAADSYAVRAAISKTPEAVIAAKDVEIAQLKADKSALEAQVAVASPMEAVKP